MLKLIDTFWKERTRVDTNKVSGDLPDDFIVVRMKAFQSDEALIPISGVTEAINKVRKAQLHRIMSDIAVIHSQCVGNASDEEFQTVRKVSNQYKDMIVARLKEIPDV